MRLTGKMPREKPILNILYLKYAGLNLFLVLPSYQPYGLSFLFHQHLFLLELYPVLCVTTQAGGGGMEAIVPDFSDLDHTRQEVLMAT